MAICEKCGGTGQSPECEMCSGDGCVYCRAEKEKAIAPDEVKGRLNFTQDEICQFKFTDNDAADIMIDYLNRRCNLQVFCPEIVGMCRTDCRCFEKARRYACGDHFSITGFLCNNPKMNMDENAWHQIMDNFARRYNL